MATSIIIGFGTLVGGIFSGACATNVSWGYSPNVQRLYCLGTISPWASIEKPTENMSVTVYQGSVSSQTVTPSTSCSDITSVSASVSPSSCGGSVEGMSGQWYIASYSYSKGDPNVPGQETWSLQRWVEGSDPSLSPAPDYVIRNITEGQATIYPATALGITFTGTVLSGRQGSVGAAAVGQANDTYYGMVTQVGGASLGGGDIGNSSANAQLTPLWV